MLGAFSQIVSLAHARAIVLVKIEALSDIRKYVLSTYVKGGRLSDDFRKHLRNPENMC